MQRRRWTAAAACDGNGSGLERAVESRTATAAKIGDNEDNNMSKQCVWISSSTPEKEPPIKQPKVIHIDSNAEIIGCK